MKPRHAWLTLCLLALAVPCAFAEPHPKTLTLHKGDTIVFFGDSITAQAVGPKGFVTVIHQTLAQQCADLAIQTIGAGVGGNKVTDLQARLDRDVLAKHPNVVVVYIGINDVWWWKIAPQAGGTPKDKFAAGLKDLITRITAAGAKVVLCTPTVIGEKAPGTNDMDAMLEDYCTITRRVAKETKTPLVDLHKAFQELLTYHNPSNKPSGILTVDGVHLTDNGNLLVAREMLAAFGVTLDLSGS